MNIDWKQIKDLIEKGFGGEEFSETEEIEEEPKSPSKDLIKENTLSDRIKKYFDEAGIDTASLRDGDDIEALIEKARSNHELRMKERQKADRKFKPVKADPWKEFKKLIEGEGDIVEEQNEEEVKGNPKTFSMTIVAIGKPKKSDDVSNQPTWKSESELEEDDED